MVSYFHSNASLPPSDTCYNCMRCNNGDTVKLSRCSKCKLAFYCSKLCIKEHWHTTHSKHCKYLSGDARKDGTDHDERKCRTCKEMSRKPHKYSGMPGTLVGCPYKDSICKDAMKTMSRLLLHHLQAGWHKDYHGDEMLDGAFNLPPNLQINLPFELGELTGNYVDKVDKVLGEMTLLIASIDLQHCEVPNWFLNSEIRKIRTFYWSCLLSRNARFFIHWFSDVNPLWASLHLINTFLKEQENPSQLWALLVLRYNYLLAQDVLYTQNQMVKSGSTSDFVQRTHQVFISIEDLEISKVWTDLSQVKTLFSRPKDLPRLECLSLTEIDPTMQMVGCSTCPLQFSTKTAQLRLDVFIHPTLLEASAGWTGPSIIIHQWSFAAFFCCGAPVCKEKVKDLYSAESVRSKPCSELMNGFECDYCGYLTSRPHRCSLCKSKHYCSPECQTLDWSLVHKKMCKEYEKDGTKMKFDTDDRKEILFTMQAERDFKK